MVKREFPLNIPDHKYARQAAQYATAAARVGKHEAWRTPYSGRR